MSGGGKGVLLGMPASELVRELQDSVSAVQHCAPGAARHCAPVALAPHAAQCRWQEAFSSCFWV
jgi:hypothetical protein